MIWCCVPSPQSNIHHCPPIRKAVELTYQDPTVIPWSVEDRVTSVRTRSGTMLLTLYYAFLLCSVMYSAALSRIQDRDTNPPMLSHSSGVPVLNSGQRSAAHDKYA
eukprot:SAG31_NODE_3003_length_4795_cov_4.386499_1_plen_106_part_00